MKPIVEINCDKAIKEMLERKLSIREMASELGVSKTCLHSKLQQYKQKLDKETLNKYEELLLQNKSDMRNKAIIIKKQKTKV